MTWRDELMFMSKPQRKYAIKKAHLEDAKSVIKEIKRKRGLIQREHDLMDKLQEVSKGSEEEREIQGKLDKVNEEIIGVEKGFGRFRLETELREAREELLEWCFDTLENRTSEDFSHLLDKTYIPSVRERLVDIAMRYRPSKDKQ